MVPSAFVVLERLPLTRNGKVDRNALPPPARDTESLDHAFFGPRNAVEKVIADVWSEVLGISQIGRHDNFFDLGGHSLKAVQIVSRLRKVFQSEIPLHFLFEFPTIATLATEISGSEDKLTTHSIDVLLSEIESMSDDETQGLAAKDIGSKIGD
jgi:acyl carrier protein